MHPYFAATKPYVLAHRGLTFASNGDRLDENTLPAFAAALDAGATHIETDIQVTSDGVPVIFHDDDLSRVAGRRILVADTTWADLQGIRLLSGGQIPSLAQALEAFPQARFNIDFKVSGVIQSACQVISDHDAASRVLVASFSDSRRRKVKALLPESATSAGAAVLISLWLAHRLHLAPWFKRLAKEIDALQIPVSQGPLRFDSPGFVRAVIGAGLELQFWTINEPTEMQRLVSLGATGVVTDRTDVAVAALRP